MGEALGLSVWNEDEAGPYQTKPYPGRSWQPEGEPAQQPHEYIREGTAKLLTLFHPADGQLRVKGVTTSANAILHPWLKEQLSAILAELPPPPALTPEEQRLLWLQWQANLSHPITLPAELPPLRMLLVWDNLAGHRTPDFVLWLFDHGIMPLFTPLAGSWLNMAESIQRIVVRRALDGQHPAAPQDIIELLEATAQAWNREPTPFEWGGKRAARRQRSRQRKQALAASGAVAYRPTRRRSTIIQKWLRTNQTTH